MARLSLLIDLSGFFFPTAVVGVASIDSSKEIIFVLQRNIRFQMISLRSLFGMSPALSTSFNLYRKPRRRGGIFGEPLYVAVTPIA